MRVTPNSVNDPSIARPESGSVRKTDKGSPAASAKKAEKPSSEAIADSVSSTISTKGREAAKAKEAATDAPDVREEKVAELRRRIAAGKYSVDSDAVADRMVNDHLGMSGIG